jgi:hypothetical protein
MSREGKADSGTEIVVQEARSILDRLRKLIADDRH